MKKSSDFIHRLIHRMSSGEKRFFNLFCKKNTTGDKNNALDLFNAINRQKVYDETKLKRKFPKNFVREKNRLKELILQALYDQHSPNSEEMQLKKQLHQVRILYQKGFKDDCWRLLKQVKKRSIEQKMYRITLDALQAEVGVRGLDKADIKTKHEEEQYYLNLLLHQSDFDYLHFKAFKINYRLYSIRNETELDALEAFMKHPLLQSFDNAKTFKAKNQFLDIHALYHELAGDFDQKYANHLKFVEYCESDKKVKEQYPYIYYCGVVNLLACMIESHRYNEANAYLKKMWALKERLEFRGIPYFENTIFVEYHTQRLLLYNAMGRFDEGMQLALSINKELSQHLPLVKARNRIFILTLLSYLHFVHQEYDQALKWINQLSEKDSQNTLHDLHSVLQIYVLILHFEMGNYDLLDYIIKSSHRYLKNRGRLYQTEKTLLKTLQKAIYVENKMVEKALFKNLWEQLEELQKDRFERPFFQFFNFACWAESKVKGITYRNVVEQKVTSPIKKGQKAT